MTGAAAVAMLVGPGGMVLEQRSSAALHVWDFFKPAGWPRCTPVMPDGKHSVDCYMQALDVCQQGLEQKLHKSVLDHVDHMVFHCTSAYLCKRGFERVYKRHVTEWQAKKGVSIKARQDAYDAKVLPSTVVTKRNGSAYTAACYVGLYTLLEKHGGSLVGERVGIYSYGSGAMSTMFVLSGEGQVQLGANSQALLGRRTRTAPKEFLDLSEKYARGYASYGWAPGVRADREDGVWYLANVDELGHRAYVRHGSAETA